MERRAAAERQATLVLLGAVAIGVAVRLLVFGGQGFPSDVGTFMAWAERLAAIGPLSFYEAGYFSDYPPGFLYVLWLVGALFDGEVLRLVVKALSIPADIALAYVLFRVVSPSAGPMAGAMTGALWMLQPGPIFAGPLWGQVDSWGTLPFLGALLAAGQRRWVLAGALAAVAAMVKPQFGLAAIVVGAAAAVDLLRGGRWRPLATFALSGLGAAVAIAVPFRLTPGAFVDLVRSASETYPYTSLYAFNVWSIVGDFWKPDAPYVVVGGVMLAAGIFASVVPLWWRRDVAMLLAAGAFVAMAFYFLPTRAHERYAFPAFALLAPFAVTRSRVLLPYVVMATAFFATLYFAFTRYEFTRVVAPPLVESTLFGRNGQIALALLMIGCAALIVWRLARGEAELRDTVTVGIEPRVATAVTAPTAVWRLPAGLGPGRLPTRRDIALALLVALAVIATRGFRLDQPRDMYFDEVYHARTAMELLAEREPYEWTHPHLAKEIMALGILAFGGDRVEAREDAPRGATAFAVSGDGKRAYGFDGYVQVTGRGVDGTVTAQLDDTVRGIAFDAEDLYAVTDRNVFLVAKDYRGVAGGAPLPSEPTGLVTTRGRVVVGTARSVEIFTSLDKPPSRVTIPTAALTAKPDSDDLFVADGSGTVHIVNVTSGQVSTRMTGPAPISALAWAQAPGRLYAGRAGEAVIDWFEPPREAGSAGTHAGFVPLTNGRTGAFSGGVGALAVVPRSQFLYALADGRAVVVETHGASPFAAIPVRGAMLGVDGTGDELAVLGDRTLERIPTGRHAFAWRLPGVVAGAVMAFFIVLLARRLFASALVAILAGAAVVLDGAMFAQARIGMNDIYIATFLVAGWYFVVAAHAPRRSAAIDLLVAGTVFGLAAASKWAAFYALAGLALLSVIVTAYAWGRERPGTGGPFDLLAWRGRVPNALYLLLCFAVIPILVYVASYARWFGGATIPYGWDLVELTKQMYWYHSGLTAPHPAGSPWWSWPFVLKPVYWYLGSPGPTATAVIYDAGNVVLFWGGVAAFVWSVIAAIRARSAALALLVFALLTQYVAWIPITRVLFFYHFFTALPFYLLILAAALTALWETGRARAVTMYVALAAAAFVFFYPFISGLPTPSDQAAVFYVLPTWQYDCQFYPEFLADDPRAHRDRRGRRTHRLRRDGRDAGRWASAAARSACALRSAQSRDGVAAGSATAPAPGSLPRRASRRSRRRARARRDQRG
ncbi:MAG: phospholipid carrier-dependent glycosyltransferase [Chloroflexi bacterium]|nr:phospholipid carrier-dependent glycosyltransferase [Chloroflexota bacterium]